MGLYPNFISRAGFSAGIPLLFAITRPGMFINANPVPEPAVVSSLVFGQCPEGAPAQVVQR
jgi:hypothetical protein